MTREAISALDRPLDRDPSKDSSEYEAEDFAPPPPEWVVLRVGGLVFETSKQTLCAEADSMLAAWVLRHGGENESVMRIDRDGRRFRHVLNYLRNGTVWLEDMASLRGLAEEAEYFCLSGLRALCEEKIRAIQEAEDARWKKSLQVLRSHLWNSNFVGSFEKFRTGCGNREVFAVLRGRRLGCGDEEEDEPEFRLDVDF